MTLHRRRPWFRMLACVLAAATGGLLCTPGLTSITHAQEDPQTRLQAAIKAYEDEGDLWKAEQGLLRVVEMLRPLNVGDPKERRLWVQAYVYLGRVAVVKDSPAEARERFAEAIRQDPSLRLTRQTDPPKIVEVFEAVRAAVLAEGPGPPRTPIADQAAPAPKPAEAAPAVSVTAQTPAERPKPKKKKWLWLALGGAAVAVAAVALAGGGGGGSDQPTPLDLTGQWNEQDVVTSNNCDFDSTGESLTATLQQSGTMVTYRRVDGSLILNGILSGNALTFEPYVLGGIFPNCLFDATISGTATQDSITGNRTYAFRSVCGRVCSINYRWTLTRSR